MIRVTTAYVSGYDRTRVHQSCVVRGESRQLVANFNGAIPVGETITTATWRTNQNSAAILSDGALSADERSTSVQMLAGWGGPAWVKVDAALSGGGTLTQVFVIRVQSAPWFTGETNPQQGPIEIVVTA